MKSYRVGKRKKRKYGNSTWYRRRELEQRERMSKKLPLAHRTLISVGILALVLLVTYTPLKIAERAVDIFRVAFTTHISAREAAIFVAEMGPAGEDIVAVFGYDPDELLEAEPVMADSQSQELRLPAVGVIGDSYDEQVGGIYISASESTPVISAAAGQVVDIRDDLHLGLTVEIDHGNGLRTTYGHLSGVRVKEYDKVAQGSVIAHVGQSGECSGPKLFFAVQLENKAVDPLSLVKGK